MPSKTEKTLSQNLKHLMELSGWNVEEVAKRSGVSKRMVSYVISMERKASITIAEDLAKAFNLEGWHLIMPNLPRDLEQSKALRRLIDDYIGSDNEGRDMISKVAEREAKYGK